MDGLNYLCEYCIFKNCEKKNIVSDYDNNCKTIKCLDYCKDKNIVQIKGDSKTWKN